MPLFYKRTHLSRPHYLLNHSLKCSACFLFINVYEVVLVLPQSTQHNCHQPLLKIQKSSMHLKWTCDAQTNEFRV